MMLSPPSKKSAKSWQSFDSHCFHLLEALAEKNPPLSGGDTEGIEMTPEAYNLFLQHEYTEAYVRIR